MSRRRFLSRLLTLSALAALPWLRACARNFPLKLGVHPWIGYETLYLAQEFGWLPATVQLLEGKRAEDSMAALRSGAADAACLTLDELLRSRAEGIPLTVVLVFDISVGADMVLARPSVRSPADLAGKRVGFERSAVGALVLEKLLEAANLPASALTLLDLPLDRQLEAWRKGEVDAIVAYYPMAGLLQREGAQRLFDSRQMPESIFDVLTVRADRAQERRATLEAVTAAHFRVLEYEKNYRQDTIYRIAAHQAATPEEVRQAFAGVVLPSLAANREYLSGQDPRFIQAARTLSELMVRQGLLSRNDSLENLVDPVWLPGGE